MCDNPKQNKKNLDYLGKQRCWLKDFPFYLQKALWLSWKACSKMEDGLCGIIDIFYWCVINVVT